MSTSESSGIVSTPSNPYTFARPRPQVISLPDPMFWYLFPRISGRLWEKLIRTCKMFFAKLQVVPIRELFDSNRTAQGIWKCWGETGNASEIRINEIPYKIRVTATFEQKFSNLEFNAVSMLIPKIVACDLKSLTLSHQNITMDEFMFLIHGGAVEHLVLKDVIISASENVQVPLETVIAKVPKIRYCSL